jgi:hypothetical protein
MELLRHTCLKTKALNWKGTNRLTHLTVKLAISRSLPPLVNVDADKLGQGVAVAGGEI